MVLAEPVFQASVVWTPEMCIKKPPDDSSYQAEDSQFQVCPAVTPDGMERGEPFLL